MNILVITCCLFAAANAGFLPYGYLGGPLPTAVPYAAPILYARPYVGSSQYRTQDTLGQYNYGFTSTDGISKSEARGIDGSVAGGYAYTAPDGKQVKISYTAGPNGFKAIGDAIPKSVEPTAEVAAATRSHADAKTEAEMKAAEAPKAIALAAPLAYAAPGYSGYAHPHPHLAYKALIHGAPAIAHHGYSYIA